MAYFFAYMAHLCDHAEIWQLIILTIALVSYEHKIIESNFLRNKYSELAFMM